jgi:preprotein translocase subunit SecF
VEFIKNYLDGLRFDFVTARWRWFSVSTLLVLASWIAFFAIGPNWGIDFTGGTEVRLRFAEPVAADEIREAIRGIGLDGEAVQQVGSASENEFAIRVQDPEYGMKELASAVRQDLEATFGAGWVQDLQMSAEVGARLAITHQDPPVQVDAVQAALAKIDGVGVQPGREPNQIVVIVPGLSKQVQGEIGRAFGERKFEVLAVDAVGPKVGDDLRRSAFVAMAATLVLILIYTAFRFDFAYAPGAILALVHDVSIPVGVFTLFGLQFDLGVVGALLTILGFSMNDTIVIYDRIRENREKFRRNSLAEVVNLSINETLTRTFATSFTALSSIALFLVMGGPVLFSFALAMLIGGVLGVYSTIFIASPMVILFDDLRPWIQRMSLPRAALAVANTGDLLPASPPIGRPAPLPQPPGPPVSAEPDQGGAGDAERPLTESEKRRRERAAAERKHAGPS